MSGYGEASWPKGSWQTSSEMPDSTECREKSKLDISIDNSCHLVGRLNSVIEQVGALRKRLTDAEAPKPESNDSTLDNLPVGRLHELNYLISCAVYRIDMIDGLIEDLSKSL